MTEESNNNQNLQPTEEQQPSDETQTELREISEEELKQILEEHEKWLESGGKEGKRADLSKANLKGAKLSGAKLQKANFEEANLQKADLRKANLQEADLHYADLQEAKLSNANLLKANPLHANLKKAELSNANLQDTILVGANLQEAKITYANLQEAKIMAANLQNANLFRANLKNANLEKANLKNANLWGASLHKANLNKADMQNITLDNAYGLNDVKDFRYANLIGATGLLGNEFAQADLTGTKLPKNYLEFNPLETVKETSQNARKIFFAMLLGCVYSWLTIATTTDVRLLTNTASSPLPIIGTEIPIAWFYIAAPLVLICLFFYFHLYLLKLWEGLAGLPAKFPDGKRLDERAYPWLLNGLVRRHFRLLKTERPFISHIQEWITIFLAWWVVPFTMIAFWLRFIPRHDWVGTIFHIVIIVLSIAFAIIFYRLCALTLRGKDKVSFRFQDLLRDRRFYYGVSVVLVGLLFSLLSYGAINGNRYIDIMMKREKGMNFYKIEEIIPWAFEKLGYDLFADFREKRVSEIPSNYGTISKEERLEFVIGAKLKEANLKYADMNDAFLVKADFRGALLNNAILYRANLQLANLEKANLQKAALRWTNLQDANLKKANLQQANLWEANLQQANLENTNLQQAILWNANLQQGNLKEANLQETISFNVNLQKADLEKANLQKADLLLMNLKNANLVNTDLTGAKNLTIEQLSQVKTLYQAKLDPELLEQVKKCCPHLLEEPKEETDQTN